MATDPAIYNSGVTGVSLPAADSPDRDNRPFYDPNSLGPPRSAHLTLLFFLPPLDLLALRHLCLHTCTLQP